MDNKWKPYFELNLDSDFTRIDTRDFDGYTGDMKDEETKLYVLEQSKRYNLDNTETIFSLTELKEALDKIYKESGETVKWRLLTFNKSKETLDWRFKYLNIFKLAEDKFVISNQHDVSLLSKQMILNGINREHLNAH